ncbi:MAG: hypothetical protein HOH73_06160, partial [Alphaproteobacteria bacterium]|nr:hypothetical protein [Alphaproteobacteria bacterium]
MDILQRIIRFVNTESAWALTEEIPKEVTQCGAEAEAAAKNIIELLGRVEGQQSGSYDPRQKTVGQKSAAATPFVEGGDFSGDGKHFHRVAIIGKLGRKYSGSTDKKDLTRSLLQKVYKKDDTHKKTYFNNMLEAYIQCNAIMVYQGNYSIDNLKSDLGDLSKKPSPFDRDKVSKEEYSGMIENLVRRVGAEAGGLAGAGAAGAGADQATANQAAADQAAAAAARVPSRRKQVATSQGGTAASPAAQGDNAAALRSEKRYAVSDAETELGEAGTGSRGSASLAGVEAGVGVVRPALPPTAAAAAAA